MKTLVKISIILFCLFFWSGCRETTVTTKVNRDGTFTRIIRITGDSSDVFNWDLPYPIDSTWVTSAGKDTSGENNYILTYSKSFGSADELNDILDSDTSWRRQLNRSVTITKRFGFFYSYIRFTEKFSGINPFNALNYTDYFTEEEALLLKHMPQTGETPDSVLLKQAEEKADDFLSRSVVAELGQILKNGIRKLDVPGLDESCVDLFHDSIAKQVERWDLEEPEKFIDLLQTWTGNEHLEALHRVSPPLFTEFRKKIILFDHLIMMETYPEIVEMPGLITGTNSISLKGNQVSWDVEALTLLFGDTEFYVESRVINNWAFVVTGIILLLLAGVLVIRALK
jgi:hypothetical protein